VKFSRSEPGFALSAAIHLGLLAAMLVAFSQDAKFDDAQEAIPVETITDSQFSQIMKGEKNAREPKAKPRAERVAEVAEQKPTPPTPEAKREIPAPPPPMKRLPDPGEAEAEAKPTPTPTPPAPPPTPVPPAPPQRPAPPTPPAKAPPQEEKKQEEKDDAEPVKPPARPRPPEKAEAKPAPTPPKSEPKPPKLEEVARLLAESKEKAASRPKSGDESTEHRPSPDLAEISKMLSREAPQALASVGREASKTASLGAPNASAAKMSPSLSDALSGLLMEQYKACWSYLPLSNGPKYVPWIRVAYRPDGSLAGEPVLTNPPSDPVSRALAESAMRAVRRCNPLKIPARFQPFYEQWKDWKVGFDPVILN
jgi:colicin import membrane protein